MWFIILVDFLNVEPPLPSWDKSRLVMVCNPFNTLLDLVCYNFVEDFCIYKVYWSVISFSFDVFLVAF